MLKRFANGAVLSGVFTLLASLQVLSDEAGKNDPAPLGNQMEAALESGGTIAVYGSRVTRLVPTAPDITAMRILEQPGHGHVSVNPDNTIALVLTRSEHAGALSFRYEVATPDGQATQHEAVLEVIPSPQESGWGTGENFYMLPVDASDRVIVEHGDKHRKVYISGAGLNAADIAKRTGTAESEVTVEWLQNHPQYGASEDMALHTGIGMKLWGSITYFKKRPFSHWLLFERGHEYDVGTYSETGTLFQEWVSGESPLHPLFVGAWGTGDRPKILTKERINRRQSSDIVVQDIDFERGFDTLAVVENLLFDNLRAGYDYGFQGMQGLDDPNLGITVRNTILKDVWRDTPSGDTSGTNFDGLWSPFANRQAGLFVRGTVGLLLDGLVFDHIGWAPDFAPDGSLEGGHPPNLFSHNIYLQDDTRDVTMRNSITMRSASFGAQFRGGAYVKDNLFIDNNIAFSTLGGDYKKAGSVGNYSLVDGNVTTASARRGGGLSKIGALNWGVRNEALLTSLLDNIVAHANDPDDPEDTAMAQSALHHSKDAGVFTDDTIIWRWGMGRGGKDGTEANTDALDPGTLNTTTIQRYTADLLDQDTATIDDFGQYLSTLDSADYAAATHDVLSYFRAGFGIAETAREMATTLRFVPDPRGDGVRWDNRLNWNSGDLPGTVAGDSVDLGGNRVVFGGTVTLDDLTFGPDGGLLLTHGRLQVTGDLEGDTGATIDIDRAGQLWAERTTGRAPLTLSVKGGRFVNAGTFDSPVRLTSTGGQTILATGGAEFRVDAQSHIHIDGAASRIGFDGDTDETALIRFEPGAMLEFTATSDGMSTIGEFRSGAFGDAPAIGSGIDLGGASLTVNLTDPTALEALILVDVDEIIGRFEDVTVQGLGDRDATVVINYKSDIVSLQLSSGTGQVSVSEIGTQDVIDRGNSEIRNRLEMAAE
jgi:hypothetical protein